MHSSSHIKVKNSVSFFIKKYISCYYGFGNILRDRKTYQISLKKEHTLFQLCTKKSLYMARGKCTIMVSTHKKQNMILFFIHQGLAPQKFGQSPPDGANLSTCAFPPNPKCIKRLSHMPPLLYENDRQRAFVTLEAQFHIFMNLAQFWHGFGNSNLYLT